MKDKNFQSDSSPNVLSVNGGTTTPASLQTPDAQREKKKLSKHFIYFLIITIFLATVYLGYLVYKIKTRLPTELLTVSTSTEKFLPSQSQPEIKLEGEIVFVRERNIWTINVDGNEEKRLTDNGTNGFPVFSPDGEWIVYDKRMEENATPLDPHDVWIIKTDGSDARKLYGSLKTSSVTTWSPDSEKIAISTSDSITIIEVESGQERYIINDIEIPKNILAMPPTWLTKDILVFLKKLPNNSQEIGVSLFRIENQQSEWLIQKPLINGVLFSKNNRLFYMATNKIWQIDVKNKKMKELALDISEGTWLSGEPKFFSANDKIIAPIALEKDNPSPLPTEIKFMIFDLKDGSSNLIETGIRYRGGTDWSFNGRWLILSGGIDENRIANEAPVSSLWIFDTQNLVKNKLTENAHSLDVWFRQ
ncbi:hypothetical protein KKB40_05175 [Patescibacteria group bacterium]|nr:hypothetical protein [Patescibacteria group bacterium]